MTQQHHADTIEVDRELLHRLLDLVAFPPEKGKAAHAGVPWAWIDELRGMLDANDGRLGPAHRFNWRRAHLTQKRNAARRQVDAARSTLDHRREQQANRERGVSMQSWGDEYLDAYYERVVGDAETALARRERELDRIERRLEATS